MDTYTLKAWCWQVLARANEDLPRVGYERGAVTLDFLTRVARLSRPEGGPRLAKELLVKRGISLVVERQLPKTYLDGAVLRLGDGRTVIDLTLRYDRIDNFWFCLLHELAHLGRHMDTDERDVLVDDFTLRKFEGRLEDPKETQADEALVPRTVWEASAVRYRQTTMAVKNLANALQVHPAIVAGRVRDERKNFRLLSQFVGTGEVRRQFGVVS